jgi:hypothetical protein
MPAVKIRCQQVSALRVELAEKRNQRAEFELIELGAGKASGDDLAGHRAGIVIQLDNKEIGTDLRGLGETFLVVPPEPRPPPSRRPAQQAEPGDAERQRHGKLSPRPKKAAPASVTIPPAVRPSLIMYFGSTRANDFASHNTKASASRPMKIVGMAISSVPA